VRYFLLSLALLAGCTPQRYEDIPTREISQAFVKVTSLKAYARVSIGGFDQSGSFNAQIVWRAPRDLRVRTSYFEFSTIGDRFQLWLPDEERFITGSVDEFRNSDHGELFHLFTAALPRKPTFIAFISRPPWNYGITEKATYRFDEATPVDRKDVAYVRYEEVRDGIPRDLLVRQNGKSLRLRLLKMTQDKTIPDELFTMIPPEGAKLEAYRP
jgi:hypothetical protein